LAQLQNLPEQFAKRLQVSLAEIRDGAEIRCIERHNAHEIDALAARLGDAARGVDAAAVGIEQQRSHHGRVEWRLAPLTPISAGDLRQARSSLTRLSTKRARWSSATKSCTVGGRNSGSSIFQARNVLLMRGERI